MDGRALTVTDIVPRTGFYDYEAKYGEGGSVHILPAQLPPGVSERALRQAELAHAALGCQGVTRSDLRYDDVNDVLVLLEVNTQPGMTPTSLAPEQAAHLGIGFDDLVCWMVEDAYGRDGEGRRPLVRPGPDPRPGPARRPVAARPRAPARPGPANPARAYAPGKLGAVKGVGLPPQIALGVALIAVLVALAGALVAEHRGKTLVLGAGASIDRAFAMLGLKVNSLTVQGATPAAQADIIKAAQIYQDQPLLGVDLAAVRARVEQVGWVKQARVVRLFPDSHHHRCHPAPDPGGLAARRPHPGDRRRRSSHPRGRSQPVRPAAPWWSAKAPMTTPRPSWPWSARGPRLTQRLDALVRVDNRRWDLRMSDGGLIQLPPTGEDSALIQLDQLDQKSRILELGFARIDLRDPEMVTVRPRDAAPPRTAGRRRGLRLLGVRPNVAT